MSQKIGYIFAFVCISALLIGGFGCSTLDPHQSDFSRTSLGKIEYERAFTACEKVMRSEFGQIIANKEMSVIEAKPQMYEGERPGLAQRGAQACITARAASMPGRAATMRTIDVSSPSESRVKASAAPSGVPK